jgi:hypothetical protein
MPKPRTYRVFGLIVRCEFELPELFPIEPRPDADVTIRLGPVEAPSGEAGLYSSERALVLVVPDIAYYRIEGGRTITVQPASGVPERNVRLYLLGSAIGAMLHQRGLLPFHASAVEIEGSAVAFMGPSGAGKSTLAAWFHDHGHRVIADDVCVVRVNGDGRAHVVPGMPRLRLWQDVLEASGRQANDYERSYAGDESWNKFDVPLVHAGEAPGEVELKALYVLARSDEFRIRPLDGIEAAEAIFANTYRGTYLSAVRGEQVHWLASTGLVRGTPVYLFERPSDLSRMSDGLTLVLAHARAAEPLAAGREALRS